MTAPTFRIASPTPTACDTLIFDLDGTLIDSAPDIRSSLNAALAEQDLEPASMTDVRRWMGDGAAVLVERALNARRWVPGGAGRSHLGKRVLQRFLDIYEASPASATRLFPHVMETLTSLAKMGIKQGICTNKPLNHSLKVVKAMGMDRFFGCVVAGDSTPRSKPHPLPLLLCLEQLGSSPVSSIMVGDSPIDLATARSAGMPSILVTWGYSKVPVETLGAHLVLNDFRDLPAILRAPPWNA